jgi:hypothetical protein
MIFTTSLVETGLYLILGKVTLKTSDKYSSKVLVFSLESATDKKYLLKESGILFELDGRLLRFIWVGQISY